MSDRFSNPFDAHMVLGVSRGAGEAEIRRARRRLARRYHPDLCQGRQDAADRMRVINQAADILLANRWPQEKARPVDPQPWQEPRPRWWTWEVLVLVAVGVAMAFLSQAPSATPSLPKVPPLPQAPPTWHIPQWQPPPLAQASFADIQALLEEDRRRELERRRFERELSRLEEGWRGAGVVPGHWRLSGHHTLPSLPKRPVLPAWEAGVSGVEELNDPWREPGERFQPSYSKDSLLRQGPSPLQGGPELINALPGP